jgi:hydrogenase maturation protein HypF
VSFDGTGYGDDGSIWGGEIFAGSMTTGFERVAHLRPAALAGGDAAAHHPVQAAAGFLAQLGELHDFDAAPFNFGPRYHRALQLIQRNVRTFTTTSMGRLFDTTAALLGFTRPITFEGQAAMWVEHLARAGKSDERYPFPLNASELDFRPLLRAVIHDRLRDRAPEEIACAFQRGVAVGLSEAIRNLAHERSINTVVLSGGVFQNELLLEDLKRLFADEGLEIWTNSAVPPNDGGISLGQAALAAFAHEPRNIRARELEQHA